MKYKILMLLSALVMTACSGKNNESVDEDTLGFITADVDSTNTNFDKKATFSEKQPGESERFDRSFENAPPLIPHTVDGFLPIKATNNICLSCHMPDVAGAVGAIPISSTHFSNLRPQPELVDGKYQMPGPDSLTYEELSYLNNQYFNCSQCHVPQAKVSIDIKNLFTPEFREQHGFNKSDLRTKISEGIK